MLNSISFNVLMYICISLYVKYEYILYEYILFPNKIKVKVDGVWRVTLKEVSIYIIKYLQRKEIYFVQEIQEEI